MEKVTSIFSIIWAGRAQLLGVEVAAFLCNSGAEIFDFIFGDAGNPFDTADLKNTNTIFQTTAVFSIT